MGRSVPVYIPGYMEGVVRRFDAILRKLNEGASRYISRSEKILDLIGEFNNEYYYIVNQSNKEPKNECDC